MRREAVVLVIALCLFLGCSSAPTCNKPNSSVGGVCCLDNNSNGVCDSVEPQKSDGVDLEAGWRICEDSLKQKSGALSDFYSTEIAGKNVSYRQSLSIYVRYSQKFDEFSASLISCHLFLESNRKALTDAGHDPSALLSSMDATYSSQKNFLDAWAKNLKVACPAGYVLGADDSCHEECGDSFCQPGTVCCNGRCQPLCATGFYMATDCRCHPN